MGIRGQVTVLGGGIKPPEAPNRHRSFGVVHKSGEKVEVVAQCLEGGMYIEKTFTIELA